MRSVFATVALPSLLLFILDGSLPPLLPVISVKAFPATASMVSTTATTSHNKTVLNLTLTSDTTAEVTEYPVFISVTEETQTSPESEVVTETYMVVEDQEVDYDDDSETSTTSPVVIRSTSPMPSPKSSPEQEEVLRELKKLWDLSEGMSDNGNDALKNSLSSIVHLAYARVYIEPDETLHKLKYLLQQLQARILLGTNLNADESISTTETVASSPSSFSSVIDAKPNDSTTTSSPTNSKATTEVIYNDKSEAKTRRKRSFYGDYEDEMEAIFFANVNSAENSVLPDDKNQYQHVVLQDLQNDRIQPEKIKANLTKLNSVGAVIIIKNDTNTSMKNPLDRTLVTFGSVSSTSTTTSISTSTPSTIVQKVVHINDRQKPMSSFYLTPERIQELKSRVTSSTTTTSTLSPLNIVIEDDLENEVNMLQQQQHVDNYDIHISSSTETLAPLTTTTPPPTSYFHKKPLSEGNTASESPFTAEDIALALFHLLRPDTFEDDESEDENVTTLPHPKPSNILYQVGSLSSVLNFTIRPNNVSTSTTTQAVTVPSKVTTSSSSSVPPSSSTVAPTTNLNTTLALLKLKEKHATKNKNNATLLVPPPTALLDLVNSLKNGNMSTSTERQSPSPSNDVYDYTDVLDQKPAASVDQESITTTIVQGTQDGVLQMVNALTRLSVGAKMVLLFSVSISIISIGFGIYALGPPLAGVGVLGIIIPIGLLLLFETTGSSGKRKLTTRQQEQLLINKLQSEEFSKILDMMFDAVLKYSKG